MLEFHRKCTTGLKNGNKTSVLKCSAEPCLRQSEDWFYGLFVTLKENAFVGLKTEKKYYKKETNN